MKIWFEALTGKQALFFHYIAKYFEEKGHTTVFTTRNYDYVEGNLRRLNRTNYFSIGKYGGTSLKSKLIAGTKRVLELAEIMDAERPDVLITLASPDASRTAFGLGIPIIQINDTPHARAVGRLTLAISEYLIHPAVINSEIFRRLGAQNILTYSGVDEILWIKDFIPDHSTLEILNLTEYNFIVVRCEESKAAYFQEMYPEVDPGSTIVVKIIEELENRGVKMKIVAFPRYEEQRDILSKFNDQVIIPDESVDTLTLLYYAKVAMTGGGTMGREGALLGTPTIYSFPKELDVSRYVTKMGFPLIHFPDHTNVPEKIIELLNYPRMEESKRIEKIKEIETPIKSLNKALNNLKLI